MPTPISNPLTVPPDPAYDGAMPFPGVDRPPTETGPRLVQLITTMLIVGLPFAGLGVAIWLVWGHGIGIADIALASVFYVVTGLGVTIGYHRCLTHGSFTAAPALRIALTIAASMSFEGDAIGWVATHRRHHAFTDRPGDPHSPYRYGSDLRGQLKGVLHAHIGWLFRDDPTPVERYAPDLLADPVIRTVSRLFPALCVASLALPFGVGWAIGGGWFAALTALLWAGPVRILLLQHVTWSVNSLCHLIGVRPFRTHRHDRATNLWPLALPSFGESWHNAHHFDPSCARHGVDRHQIDVAARTIWLFEKLGWATDVHWPDPARLDRNRLTPEPAE